MSTPDPPVRFLRPGELAFTSGLTQLKTLLGSCVAITLWHPATRQGAMCHFLLPANLKSSLTSDGRYGEDAVALLHRHFQTLNLPPGQVKAGLFGGADVTRCAFGLDQGSVGARNVALGRSLLDAYGYPITQEVVRGTTARMVILDPSQGTVTVTSRPHHPTIHERLP